MKIQKGLFAIFAIAILGIGAVSAYGWMNEENKDSIHAAMEAGNYDAWKEAHMAQLTEEDFQRKIEHYKTMQEFRGLMEASRNAMISGDSELATKLKTEAQDLKISYGSEFGHKIKSEKEMGKGNGMRNCPFSN